MSNIWGPGTAKAEGSFGILYFHCELRTVEQREVFLILCIWRFLYNTHQWRHFGIVWNIPDLIHILILLIRYFLELLKWLKCRADKGFELERFRTQNTCSGALSFVSQQGSTCLLVELSTTSSVSAAVVFVCLYVGTHEAVTGKV